MNPAVSVSNYMDGLILKIVGLFFCLFSAVLVFLFLDWRGAGLSFLSFIFGFFLIVYGFGKSGRAALDNPD